MGLADVLRRDLVEVAPGLEQEEEEEDEEDIKTFGDVLGEDECEDAEDGEKEEE